MHVYDALSSQVFEKSDSCKLVYPLLNKHPEPVFCAEAPWEFHWVHLGRNSVLYDPRDNLFKMWYLAADPDHPERKENYAKTFLRCYATSQDGIAWNRPTLGLFEHRGNKNNNIIDEHAGDGLFNSVVLDLQEKDPSRKFKSLGFCDIISGEGIYTGSSADGLNWKSETFVAPTTQVTDGDSLIGRHPLTNKWMAVIRPRTLPKRRFIGISFSEDFTTWSSPFIALTTDYNDPPDDQFDNLTTTWLDNYFVGLIGVYHTHPEDQTYDSQLAFSHDGTHWHRPTCKPIIPLSSPGQWDDSMVRPSSIIRRGEELFIYYSGVNRGQGTSEVQVSPIGSRVGNKIISSSIGLIRTPIHRFAAIEPCNPATGIIETRFILVNDTALYLNADSTHGSIRVQVSDPTGKPIEGLTFDECIPVQGNATNLKVKWKNTSLDDFVGDIDKKERFGSVVKLSFLLENSRLYAFNFAKP